MFFAIPYLPVKKMSPNVYLVVFTIISPTSANYPGFRQLTKQFLINYKINACIMQVIWLT